MEVADEVIQEIKRLTDHFNNANVHINNDDTESQIRAKDMTFGRASAYNEVCRLLNI